MKIAAVGDPAFISVFELLGAEGFEASNDDLLSVLRKIVEEDYALVVLPEKYVEATRILREQLAREGRVTPLFAFLPTEPASRGARVEELRKLISLAIGAELKL